MDISSDSKIDLIILVAQKCADILKDPTFGGTKDLSSEARTNAREEAYEDLLNSINCLGELATFNEEFFDVVNIANKLKIDAGVFNITTTKNEK
jgi:hypothetical protein